MPQTAKSLHLYIRNGGYEPGFSTHWPDEVPIDADHAQAVATLAAPVVSEDVVIARWERQAANGTVETGGLLSVAGTWLAGFADFKDCTHFTLESDGPEGDSGFFIHPRPSNAYSNGSPIIQYDTAVKAFVSGLIALGLVDSEGFDVSDLKRYKPSRRNRVRVAP